MIINITFFIPTAKHLVSLHFWHIFLVTEFITHLPPDAQINGYSYKLICLLLKF